MSKTSRKSLPTVLLALCLLITQALLLARPSTTHADVAVGLNIFANPGSSTTGLATNVTITGTGFTPNGAVLITFNAPYSTDGSPNSPRTVPPSVSRPGDNRPQPPTSAGVGSYPNVIVVPANADVNGNLVASDPSAGPVRLPIPQNAVDGVYDIVAYDLGSGKFAPSIQYVIQRSVNQPLTVTPVSGSSAQISGLVRVTAVPGTFNNADNVEFFLEDFTASATFTAPQPASFYTFNGLLAPAVARLPLNIVNCGTTPVPTGNTFGITQAPGDNAGGVKSCQASINGDVAATVQVQTGPYTNLATGGAYPCLLSTYYYDQVYAIVAQAVSNVDTGVASGRAVAAGFHLDHGFAQISLSTNQQALGGALVVNGTGFGAFSAVSLFYVPLGISGGSPSLTGLTSSSASFASAYPLAALFTDGNGSFTSTVSVSGSSLLQGIPGQTAPGFILAEDFSANPNCLNARMNEAATAALTLTTTSGSGTLVIGPSAIATSSGTYTAAISATVVVSGTGFLPNEAVDIVISGSGKSTTILPIGAPVLPPGSATCNAEIIAVVHANASGVATGSFLIPENCNTVTVSGGRINGGANVSVDAIGEQSGIDDGNTLQILKTTAQIAPVFGLSQTGTGTAFNVILTGDGFAANEPVTFQFGSIDPFTGALTTPILSVSGTSDINGHVAIPAQTLSGSLPGGLYTLVARGLASSFSTSVVTAIPFIYSQGNLNCPTTVLPGQPFSVAGLNFSANTTVFYTITPQNPSIPSVPNPVLPVPVVSGYAAVNASGNVTLNLVVPPSTVAGTYVLSVSGLISNAPGSFQEQLRECVITVGATKPAIQAVPTSGNIGTNVTVTGQGFGPNEPITVSLQYFDVTGALTGTDVPGTAQVITNTDATGAFTGTFVVKSSVNALIPGQYNLTATGAFNPTKDVARTPFIVTGGAGAPVTSLFFAEGYTGTVAAGANADFTESLSILNANNYTTTYTVTYFLENVPGAASTQKVITGTIGANSVVERSVNTDVGTNQKVASEVSSPAPLAATRVIMRSSGGKALDSSSSLGQLLNLSSTATSFTYYFASGEVQLTNEEYLTVLNPNATAASLTINILPQAVISSTSVPTIAPITASVPGNSRLTVPIRARLVSSGLQKFGMTLVSNVPVAAERVEYFGDGIGSGKYGATTKPAGTSAFRQYIFASNVGTNPSTGGNLTVGTGKDLSEVDVINPGPAAAGSATVTVSFFGPTGAAINSQQVQVDGGTRETISVNDVVGTQTDVFSVVVTSDKNVFVEKPVFYGGDPNKGGTFAVAAPSGSPAGLTSVAFPYLDLAGPTGQAISQTVFLYNPGATSITVRGTYVSNGASVTKTYTVAANSVTTVSVTTDAAALTTKAPLGGIFQIVQTGSGQGDSFVASVTSNSPNFAQVLGNQGTYPIGASS